MIEIAVTHWELERPPLPWEVKDQDVEIITPGFEAFLNKVAPDLMRGINAQFTYRNMKGEQQQ